MFQIDTTGRTRGHSLKLVKYRCNKDIRKYFFCRRVVSKWNMLDNDSVMAKTVNGFKTKRERAKKMGLFLDWCLLDLEAMAEFRSGHPASIFAPASSLVEMSTAYVSAGAVSCRQHRILLAVLWNYENMQLTWRTSYPLEDIASIYSDPNPSYWVWWDDGTWDNGTVWERWFMTGQSTVRRPVVCLVVYDGTDEGTVLEMENQQNSNRDKLKQIMYLTVYIPHAQC